MVKNARDQQRILSEVQTVTLFRPHSMKSKKQVKACDTYLELVLSIDYSTNLLILFDKKMLCEI